MAAVSDLLARVHDEFPAVPEQLALRVLSDSVKEFCRRSHAWQEELPSVRTRANAVEYELSPDDGVVVVAVKEVRLKATGERILPYASELKRILVTPIAPGKPLGYIQRRPTTIELVNASDAVTDLTVKAALTLADGATDPELPDELTAEYAEQLGAGAKMRLVKQAGQPWFAPDAAPLYAREFYRAVNEAKWRAMSALGEAGMQVEMRSW